MDNFDNIFNRNLKFSLVVATKNRVVELEQFLESLVNQTYNNFEIIIVDQNEDRRLVDVVANFRNRLNILHITSETGISKARNKGLQKMLGDIVAFPDDDCLYPSDLLSILNQLFLTNSDYNGISGSLTEDVNLPITSKNVAVNKKNIWKTVKSATIFLQKEVIKKTGLFDENLGIGSATGLGAGEETDYLLRVINNGFSIVHITTVRIIHPPIIKNYNQWLKVFNYTKGSSYVLRKYRFPVYIFLYQISRPVIGIFFFGLLLQRNRVKYYYYSLRGKLSGYFTQLANEK
jgi:glycosyltransferase involved in cell wall biosynthesis